jgi:hypothetical protein
MKIELEKIRLGHSPLSGRIFAGSIIKEGVWRNKIDVTNDFLQCVINKWEGHEEVIEANGEKWKISIKKLSK